MKRISELDCGPLSSPTPCCPLYGGMGDRHLGDHHKYVRAGSVCLCVSRLLPICCFVCLTGYDVELLSPPWHLTAHMSVISHAEMRRFVWQVGILVDGDGTVPSRGVGGTIASPGGLNGGLQPNTCATKNIFRHTGHCRAQDLASLANAVSG